jgi:hypothetical protein
MLFTLSQHLVTRFPHQTTNFSILFPACHFCGHDPFRSLWHAPDRDGKMEVQLLPGQLPPGHKWPRQQSIAALQAPDVTTELQVAEFISTTELRGWPLLNWLLQQQQQQQQQVALLEPLACGSEAATDKAGGGAAAEQVSSSKAASHIAAAAAEQQADRGDSGSDSDAPAAKRSAKRSNKRNLISFSSDEEDGWDSDSDRDMKQAAVVVAAAGGGAVVNSKAGSAVSDDDDKDVFAAPLATRQLQQQQQHGVSKKVRLSKVDAAAAASDAELADADALDDWDDEADGKRSSKDKVSAVTAAAAAAGDDDSDAAAVLQAQAEALLAEVVQRFRLNAAQAAVAAHVASWLPQLMLQSQGQQQQQLGLARQGLQRPESSKLNSSSSAAVSVKLQARGEGRSPVCLIHGPFGSGKSTLLVALIHLVTGLVPGVSAAGRNGHVFSLLSMCMLSC